MLCGEMYGAPYDLLATYLGVREDRLRGIAARWRAAGYAETGRLGPGPAWCWLTRNGLAATGQGFAATPPSLGLLAHLRAVLAARMALESSDAGQAGTTVVALGAAHPRRDRRPRRHPATSPTPKSPGPRQTTAPTRAQRTQTRSQLHQLTSYTGPATDPELLDALPQLPARLTDLPLAIRIRLYQALGIEAVYKHDTHQITCRALITTSTAQTVAAIIDEAQPSSDSALPPIRGPILTADEMAG